MPSVLKPFLDEILMPRSSAMQTESRSKNGGEECTLRHEENASAIKSEPVTVDSEEQHRSSLHRRLSQSHHSCRTSSPVNFFRMYDFGGSIHSGLRTILLISIVVLLIPNPAAGCSSRSTPKPRPPPPSPSPMPSVRPNITFQTYACPPAYATYFCLNGATCFTIKIGESILYNCECTEGYMGQRCEYKDLDGSYLPLREKIMLERASIAGGATMAIILVVIISIIFYTYAHQRKKEQSLSFVQVTVGKFDRKPQFMAACHFGGSCECHQKKKGYPIFYDEHHPLTQDFDGVGVSKLIEVDVRYTYADCPVRKSFHLRNINQQLFNNKMDSDEVRRSPEEHIDILHQKGNCKDQVLFSTN